MKSLLVALLALASASVDAQPASRIPVEDFAAPSQFRNPVLSPAGRSIAAWAETDGNTRLLLMDADRPENRGRSFDFANLAISEIHWAGENKLLLEVIGGGKFRGVSLPVMRLIVFDVATGQSWIADEDSRGMMSGNLLFVDDSGSYALISSEDELFSFPSVKRVDLVSGRTEVVEKSRPGIFSWFVDGKGIVRGGLAYEQRRWKIWYRASAGEPLRLLRGKQSKNDDSNVDRVIFAPGGENATILTDDRTGRFALYNYDLQSGEPGTAVFEHPEVDVSSVLIDPASRRLAGIRLHDDRWRTHWLDPELNRLQSRIDQALPGLDNRILAPPGQRDRILVWSTGASDPGTYYLLDRKTATMKAVASPFARIDPAALAPVRPMQFTARDGLRIRAFLTLPVGRPPTSLPLIVVPHGGPFARDEWTYNPLVQMLANRGYAVLQPQFRGSTGFGKAFVERGYGEWGRKMQDDLDDAVDWLASTGQIDPGRVCIVGASYGGYAALWGVVRNPERYRCAASFAGVTDLASQLKANRAMFTPKRYRIWRDIVRGESAFNLKDVSPLHQADRISRPVLIAHGEKDAVVPVEQGRKLARQLERRTAEVTAVFYPNRGIVPRVAIIRTF